GWIQHPDAARYREDSKRSQYDAGLRTPILVRWPGHITPRTVDVPVSSIDLAPTILTACDLKPTPAMSGVNLLDEAAVRARKAIFGACFLHNAVDLDVPQRNLTYRWCIEDRWKLIRPDPVNVTTANKRGLAPDSVELYDLIADPHEERNLAGNERGRVEAMTGLLNRWWPGR
ncbi:MAG: sulfatase-like hydrolase/transferase, partial [Verrucomicrobiae bacterium]|nr:sulfatase-like hydrolase/transferase [Verrucomicrobiae bacterium]